MKIIKIIIFTMFIFLFVSLSYFFYDFVSTPKFSIYKIQKSMINKDYQEFSKYVDLEQVIDRFLEQQIENLKNQKEDQSFLQKLVHTIQLNLLESQKKNIKSTLISLIEQYFQTNSDKHNQTFKKDYFFQIHIDIYLKEELISLFVFYYIDSIDCKKNHHCFVNIKTRKNLAKQKLLQLEFYKQNNIWRLISINNLYEFL